MTCSQCGYENPPDAQLCKGCGHELSAALKSCSGCGSANSATARFCNSCGHPFDAADAPAAAASISNPLPMIGVALILLALLILSLTVGSATPHPATGSATTTMMIRVLATILASLALGGAIACAVLIDSRWRRYFVSAVIGIIAVLFFDSAPTRPFTGYVAGDLAVGICGTCFTTFLASSFFEGWTFGVSGAEVRTNLRSVLLPQNWTGVAVTEPLPARDLVARWFVAVAASTGSVVGALMTQREFWDAVVRTLAPTRLIFTLLLAVVSITLIGPLEEYIFGRRISRRSTAHGDEPHGARGLFEDVWENFSARAMGRLLLVLLFSFQPALLDACVGETISRGDINATFLILTSSVGPALITYYWSAALQRGAPSITRQAGRSSTVLSAILWYPPCYALLIALAFDFVVSDPQNNGKMMIVAFFLGMPLAYGIALAWGFFLNGMMAYGGGWVLDRVRAQREVDTLKTVAMLGAVLALINLLLFTAGMLLLMLFTGSEAKIGVADWGQTILGLLSTVGWIVGLVVSGFPGILHGARNRPTTTTVDTPAKPVIAA